MLLTILTPTYNREKLLKECYLSLKNQSLQDFEWLIIDDGSTDDTKKIVYEMKEDDTFPIRYLYKENGGKHTALNLGFKEAKGEFTIILDSDDILTKDAVETISKLWDKYRDNEEISSISFLKAYKNGNIIGDKYPTDDFLSNYIECRINMGIHGDKSEVYVTEILKQYQFPVFEKEKFLTESVVWTQIGRKYKTVYVNKVIYIAEYLNDGLTKSSRKLRAECCKGSMYSSKDFLKKDIKLTYRAKNMILYTCFGLFDNKKISWMIRDCGLPKLFIVTLPLAYLLNNYWKYKYINK